VLAAATTCRAAIGITGISSAFIFWISANIASRMFLVAFNGWSAKSLSIRASTRSRVFSVSAALVDRRIALQKCWRTTRLDVGFARCRRGLRHNHRFSTIVGNAANSIGTTCILIPSFAQVLLNDRGFQFPGLIFRPEPRAEFYRIALCINQYSLIGGTGFVLETRFFQKLRGFGKTIFDLSQIVLIQTLFAGETKP